MNLCCSDWQKPKPGKSTEPIPKLNVKLQITQIVQYRVLIWIHPKIRGPPFLQVSKPFGLTRCHTHSLYCPRKHEHIDPGHNDQNFPLQKNPGDPQHQKS